MTTLRNELRRYYEAEEPSERLQERVAMLTESVEARQGERRLRRLAPAAALAAALVLLAVAWTMTRESATEPYLGHAALEVATHHAESAKMDHLTSDWEALRAAFPRFDIGSTPEWLAPRELRLIGGKYCSVQGSLSVQSRLQGPDRRSHTLFVTASPLALEGSTSPTLVQFENSHVETWVKDGRLYLLASD